MTRNADFKRRVRERMARTGESYAAGESSGGYEKTVVGLPGEGGDTPVYEKTVVGMPGPGDGGYDPPPQGSGGDGAAYDKTTAFTKPDGGGSGA